MGDKYRAWLKKRLAHYEKQRALDKEHNEKQMALNKEFKKLKDE
jgi:hypothetical protein